MIFCMILDHYRKMMLLFKDDVFSEFRQKIEMAYLWTGSMKKLSSFTMRATFVICTSIKPRLPYCATAILKKNPRWPTYGCFAGQQGS